MPPLLKGVGTHRGDAATCVDKDDSIDVLHPIKRMKTERRILEEVVTLEETRSILLRFPCFDFFRNIHMCENSDGDFLPHSVRFVPGTICSQQPLLVINAGTPAEMVFSGMWEEVIQASSSENTNRAIVHLTNSEQDKTAARKAGDKVDRAPASALSSSISVPSLSSSFPQVPLPSLLSHVPEGVTADEERQQRDEKAQWRYDAVEVPSAVLLLHRRQ